MKFYYQLTPALIGVTIALVQTQVAMALSATEVNNIAKQITVLIQSKKPKFGSGVIIKKEGNTYTVLTAAHVVEVKDNYEIITPDGQRYAVNYSSVKQMPGVDLAVVQFSSSQNYSVAKIGNSDSSTEGTTAYVAGFPAPTFAINQSIYTFSDGKITANASRPLRDGYALVYSNNTSEGMSGGAVLNEKGELIAVHGRADLDTKEIKTGFNLGIPINTFLRLSAKSGVETGVSAAKTSVATAPKASDLFIQGGDKYIKGDFKGAIVDYTEAIRLNPRYAEAYGTRGIVRYLLFDYQGAINDYNLALKINPNDAQAYNNRGLARSDSGDYKGALADFNQAIKINPKDPQAYYNRGLVHILLEDKQGAIADFKQVITLNPDSSAQYSEIKDLLYALSNNNGDLPPGLLLISSANQAERRSQLMLIDTFTNAIKINPNNAQAYYRRGVARAYLGDHQGANADFQKAANIYQQQGKSQEYQDAMNRIRKLQQ